MWSGSAPPATGRDNGKPGESRGRKATRLTRARRAMLVEPPNGNAEEQMKRGLLYSIIALMVLGCTRTIAGVPEDAGNGTVVPPSHAYYVALNGSASGDGSVGRPWDIATAFAQPASVAPGDTIWLRGGVYRAPLTSYLTGSTTAPVIVRQYPGERATIDGDLRIHGANTWYWGFEWTFSDPQRITATAGSWPADIARGSTAFGVYGPNIKLINLTIHDGSNGVFAGLEAPNLEIYGSVIYNSGFEGPDRGHGHTLYLQNRDGVMRVVDNVLFNSFDVGVHLYGTDDAYLLNYYFEGNAIFGSGTADLTHGAQLNIQYTGGAGKLGHSTFLGNSIYHNGRRLTAQFGEVLYIPGTDLVFSKNISQGEILFREWYRYTITDNKMALGDIPTQPGIYQIFNLRYLEGVTPADHGHVIDGNSYAYKTDPIYKPFFTQVDNAVNGMGYYLDDWKTATGYDQHGTHVEGNGVFATPDIVIRPNKYEPGRAFIYCWNWNDAASLQVNPAGVLTPGDHYEIVHVYDLFGTPVVSGTYQGGQLTLPQNGYTPPIPIGYRGVPASSSPRFNVFLLRRR